MITFIYKLMIFHFSAMNLSDRIRYEILPDGTCSYCGSEARWIGLPDGDATIEANCMECDEFNQELLLEEYENDY